MKSFKKILKINKYWVSFKDEKIELLNKLKLLIESIYPRYDLLCKPISNKFGSGIRINNNN